MNELEELKSATEYFGISEDFTMEEIKRIMRPLVLKYHPDQNGLKTEDRMKTINMHYNVLLKYAKLHKIELDNKLKDEASQFRKRIVNDKLKHNHESVTQLVNKYMILLNNVVGFSDLRKLKKEYELELNKVLYNLKKAEDFNLEVKKKSWARAFKYKFDKAWSNRDSMEETVRKTKTFLTLLELLQKARKDNIDSLISKIGYVEFIDYEHDADVIQNVMNEFTLYINIETGSYAFVDRIDKDEVYYRKQLSDELAKGNTKKFLQLHISLEDFLRNAAYVGDRNVALYRITGKGEEFVRGDSDDTIIGRYLYFDDESGLMLTYKQTEPLENFSFYPTPRNPNINIIYQFKFASRSKREEPEKGKYQDRRIVYDELITQIKNNKLRRETKENKNSEIKR